MLKICTSTVLSLLIIGGLSAQSGPPATEIELEEAYQKRIQQEQLYGVYIPADLGEAFIQLNRRSNLEDRQSFIALSEQDAATVPFFGLGRWISYNWGFYGGSRFSNYLNQMGLHNPDDMTRFVLVMYHRHLNEKDLDPRPVVEGLLEQRRQSEQDRLLQGDVLFEETRQLERPDSTGGQ